jgi:GTP-binding protein Era
VSTFRSGYVALIGRPNVGKSTLLNALVGTKLAATTHKPQTTRKNLLGVLHEEGAQILLLDTPGYHRAKGPLNRFMVSEARSAIRDADVIGYLVEARGDGQITPGNEPLIDMLKRAGKPVVLLVNKIDTLRDRKSLLFQLQAFQDALGDVLATAVPISAMKKDGLDRVVKSLAAHLPEGPAYFEDGQVTDKTERQIVSELIREKVILETRDELPYAAHVDVERFEDERPKIVRIAATVVVERSSQKPIVIGRGGERIKAIGVRARQELEHFLDAHVFLELHVRVQENWTNSPTLLADLGYSSEGDVAAAGDEDDADDDLLDEDGDAADDDDGDAAGDGDEADADDGDDDEADADDGADDEADADDDDEEEEDAVDDDDTLPTPSERAR